MIIGVSSKLLWPRSVLEVLATAKGLGYRHVEIWAEHCWRDGVSPADVANQAQALGLQVSVHASTADLNLTSSNAGIRKESLEQTKCSIILAKSIGADVVTVHPGRISSSKDDPKEYWPFQIEALSILAETAETYGVRVAVENMENRDKEFVVSWESVEYIMREVPSPSLGITLDVAHAFTYYGDFLRDFLDVVDFSRVINIHISGSGHKTHLPLYEGELPLEDALVMVSKKYSGPVVVEGYQPGNEIETLERNFRWWSEVLRRGGSIGA